MPFPHQIRDSKSGKFVAEEPIRALRRNKKGELTDPEYDPKLDERFYTDPVEESHPVLPAMMHNAMGYRPVESETYTTKRQPTDEERFARMKQAKQTVDLPTSKKDMDRIQQIERARNAKQ